MKRALIIDDTRLARQELQFLLQKFPEITVIGEAANAEEARRQLEPGKPDLLFLDIQMPGEDGFQFLESLDATPEVIFVTAYDAYAMKAFEYNALDYLLKPVTEARLRAALDKIDSQPGTKAETIRRRLDLDSRVFVKEGERCWFVFLREVRLFEVMDNYTRIYFGEEKPLIPKPLSYLESRLDPEHFFRANRQQIVNTQWIDHVEPWFSGTLRLTLQDGAVVEVSRRQTARFKEMMGF